MLVTHLPVSSKRKCSAVGILADASFWQSKLSPNAARPMMSIVQPVRSVYMLTGAPERSFSARTSTSACSLNSGSSSRR